MWCFVKYRECSTLHGKVASINRPRRGGLSVFYALAVAHCFLILPAKNYKRYLNLFKLFGILSAFFTSDTDTVKLHFR